MERHWIRVLGAMAVAIAASAAGCGDDETGSGSSGSGATASTTSAGPASGQGGSSTSAGGGSPGSGGEGMSVSAGGAGPTSASSGGGTCPPDAADDACHACLKMSCCDELTTCGDDAGCKCWVDCMNTINNYSKCFKAPGNCGPFSPMAQALVQCDQGKCGASCQQ